MQKFKAGAIRGIQNHNDRLKESKTNPDINHDKTYLNKDLYKMDENKTYYNRVKDRIKELNLPKAVRKDAVTMCGFVCTSDKIFFDKLPQSEQDRFFKESYDFLKSRYGEKNVVASTVHYDEKTPHLHCYIVPVTKDGRLSAKDIFTRIELQKLQTDYHKHMNDRGFDLDRGLTSDGKRKHLDTQKFKEVTLKEKIKTLEQETDTLKNDLNVLKRDLNRVSNIKARFHEVDSIEGKYGLLNKQKVTIDAEDFQMLKDMAKKHHVLDSKIKKLEHENSDMKSDISKFIKTKNKEFDKSHNLQVDLNKANKKLTSITEQFEVVVKFLDKIGELNNAKDYLREQLDQKVQHKYKQQAFQIEK